MEPQRKWKRIEWKQNTPPSGEGPLRVEVAKEWQRFIEDEVQKPSYLSMVMDQIEWEKTLPAPRPQLSLPGKTTSSIPDSWTKGENVWKELKLAPEWVGQTGIPSGEIENVEGDSRCKDQSTVGGEPAGSPDQSATGASSHSSLRQENN